MVQVLNKKTATKEQMEGAVYIGHHSVWGKDLVCFCKPDYCHGDILIEVANAP